MSIIMAIVKYSVFSEQSAWPLSSSSSSAAAAVTASASLGDNSILTNLQTNQRQLLQRPRSRPLVDLTNSNNLPSNNKDLGLGSDYSSHYEAKNCDSNSNINNTNNSKQQHLDRLLHNYCQVNNLYNEILINKTTPVAAALSSSIGVGKQIAATDKAGCAGRVAVGELEIMNHFLKTWNGTQNAYDAINKLQVSCLFDVFN